MSRKIKLDDPRYRKELREWLLANGLATHLVYAHQDAEIEEDSLTLQMFVINEDGHKIVRDDEPWIETVTVPLTSSPAAHNIFS